MSDFSKLMQNEIKKIPRVPRLEWLCLTSMDNIYLNPEFLKEFIYLFLERGGKSEKEREKHQSLANPQPRHVPWLGIKPTAF